MIFFFCFRWNYRRWQQQQQNRKPAGERQSHSSYRLVHLLFLLRVQFAFVYRGFRSVSHTSFFAYIFFFCLLLQHMFRRFLDGALQALYANTVARAICLWENCSEPRWSCAKQRTAKKKLTNIAALLPHGKGFLCDYAMLKHEYLVLACNFCKKQTKISNVCLSGISMVVWLHFTQPQCVQCHLDSGAAFVNEHSDTQRGCWAVECFVRVL